MGGISPSLTQGEEAGWKNNFEGSLPFGRDRNTFADGRLAQTNGHNAAITLTFSGLQAGIYTLSAFGGFHGQDPMNNLTAELSTTADWTTQRTNTTDGAWEAAVTSTGTSYNFNNSSSALIDHGYALTAENITVGEDGNLTFTIKGVGGSEYGRPPSELRGPDAGCYGSGTGYSYIEPSRPGRTCTAPPPQVREACPYLSPRALLGARFFVDKVNPAHSGRQPQP